MNWKSLTPAFSRRLERIVRPQEVMVTRSEVALDRTRRPDTLLAVVHSIQLDRSGPQPIASGGILRLVPEWPLADEDLEPLAFDYRLPEAKA